MKKKKSFIFKICSALLMAFIFVLSFTCKSYAWYINEDGNLQSDNLFNINDTDNIATSTSSITYSITNDNLLIINNGGGNWARVQYSLNNLSSNTTYTLSFTQTELTYCYIFDNDNYIYRGDGQHLDRDLVQTFTTTSTFSTLYIAFYDSLETGNTISNIMLNSGSSAMPYVPYGIWYSETNYNNNGTSNYNTGFENGMNSITSMFRRCSSVEQTINSVTTTFDSDSNGSAFEKWFNQSNGTICSFEDGGIDINYARLASLNNIDLGYSYGLKFYFNIFVPSTLYYDYYRFDSNVTSNIYVYCDGYSFFSSDGELFIDNLTAYNIESVYFYVSRANPGPLEWHLFTVDDASSAYSSGYTQGQEVGYENGYNAGYDVGVDDGEISGFNKGYAEGSNSQIAARRLFWTIASTPFESFKTIWNVDVLGLNISGIILGVLMALLVIYLIKKIWR